MIGNDAVEIPFCDCLRATSHSPTAMQVDQNIRNVGGMDVASGTYSLSCPSHQTVFLFVQLKGFQLLHENSGVPPDREYCRMNISERGQRAFPST